METLHRGEMGSPEFFMDVYDFYEIQGISRDTIDMKMYENMYKSTHHINDPNSPLIP